MEIIPTANLEMMTTGAYMLAFMNHLGSGHFFTGRTFDKQPVRRFLFFFSPGNDTLFNPLKPRHNFAENGGTLSGIPPVQSITLGDGHFGLEVHILNRMNNFHPFIHRLLERFATQNES